MNASVAGPDSSVIVDPSGVDLEDLDVLVDLHRRELRGGFLSSLGPGALKLMFRFAAESPASILLVARRIGQRRPIGFVLGAPDTKAFYRAFIRKSWFRSVIVLGPKLLSPSRVFRILETLLYPQRHVESTLPRAELFDLVVDREEQRSGVGRLLFEGFRTALQRKGELQFRVTTGEALVDAHRFYERLGARHVSNVEVHAGAMTRVYVCATHESP
jgi:GNAT superfamily N-acetyltransferase